MAVGGVPGQWVGADSGGGGLQVKGCLINLKRARRNFQNANETINLVREIERWKDREMERGTWEEDGREKKNNAVLRVPSCHITKVS